MLIRALAHNGSSAVWALVPTTVVFLLVVRAVSVSREEHNPTGIVGLAAGVIERACIAQWIALVVVAVMRWSARREVRRRRHH